MKNKFRKLVTSFILTAVVLPITVFASEAKKEENVYVNLNSDGSLKGVHVINTHYVEEKTTICDYGTYSSVRNLTNTKKLSYFDNKTCIDVEKGIFYYQGNMNVATVELPWEIDIKYYLDGKEVAANKLAGASGSLVITLDITQNKNANPFYFENYLLQVTLTFNNELTRNIKAEGATIVNNARNKEVKYTILSGKEKRISLSADVKDFEMSNISINAVPMQMDVSIEGIDDMLDQITELQAAIKKIDQVIGQLDGGISIINKGSTELLTGAGQLRFGLGSLSSNGPLLTYGANGIKDAIDELKGNASYMNTVVNSQIGDLASLIGQYTAKVAFCSNPTNGCEEDVALYTATIQHLTILGHNKAFIESLDQNATILVAGYNEFYTGFTQYEQGVNQIVIGYDEIFNGMKTLEQGLKELNAGSSELAQGSKFLASSTSTLDKVISDKVSSLEENFKNSGFKPVSFASIENTDILAVQFVIITDSIKKPVEVVKTPPAETNKSIWDKFVALFG